MSLTMRYDDDDDDDADDDDNAMVMVNDEVHIVNLLCVLMLIIMLYTYKCMQIISDVYTKRNTDRQTCSYIFWQENGGKIQIYQLINM